MLSSLLLKTRLWLALLGMVAAVSFPSSSQTQNNSTQSGPSDVVREFYKAMREHRFRDAFSMTTYKPAIDGLSAEDMEDLRPGFEEKAAQVPDPVEITGEQISGNSAMVFVRIPATESTPQVTSQPMNLISSGGKWIIAIGTEADQAEVKKAGKRFFLDAMMSGHEADTEYLLKNRVFVIEGLYGQQHNGTYAELPALISGGLISSDAIDPKLSGYNFHITLGKDGKSYVAGAEPVRHGHTGKLSFWMDQTGVIKSADNGGKPIKP